MSRFIRFALFIIAGYASISPADTVIVNPSMTTDQINQAITASEPNDIIIFEDGSYNVGPYPWNYYNLLPNRDYSFGDVIISGTGLEHMSLFQAQNGGNINIVADNLTLQQSNVGIGIGNVPYDNINITGVNFTVYRDAVAMENRKHESPLEEAAVVLSYCTADGGLQLLYHSFGTVTDNSPWAGVENCTAINLTASWAIDVPSYRIEIGSDYETIMLGIDDLNNNVFVNVEAFSDPEKYVYYNSPKHNAYQDVEYPYIGDPDNGNIIVDPNDFLPDGITPIRDGRLNLGEGNYIGSIEPYHELAGNLNFDEFVNIHDLAVVANRFDGDLTEVLLVASDWLSEEPTDPLGNPK